MKLANDGHLFIPVHLKEEQAVELSQFKTSENEKCSTRLHESRMRFRRSDDTVNRSSVTFTSLSDVALD